MRLGRIVPATELFSQFRAHVLDDPTAPNVTDLIHELCRDASVLKSFDAQPPGSIEEQFFRHLGVLDTTTVLPVALLLYSTDGITAEGRQRALQALESWLIRRMICGYTTRGYNRLVGDLLKEANADPSAAPATVVAFLKSSDATSAVWPSDAEVTRALVDRDLYGWVNQRRIVMLLSTVEMELRRSNKVEDIYSLPSNLTIEHIMPQSWADHWPLADPDDQESRDRRINRIGNLTLTSGPLNSSLSNSAWDTKRPALAQHSLLLLNQRITAHGTWDDAMIDERGEELAETICRLWPGPADPCWNTSASSASPITESPQA
jgi:hypothetical protein